MFRLDGMNALVTGASGGIGSAIVAGGHNLHGNVHGYVGVAGDAIAAAAQAGRGWRVACEVEPSCHSFSPDPQPATRRVGVI